MTREKNLDTERKILDADEKNQGNARKWVKCFKWEILNENEKTFK